MIRKLFSLFALVAVLAVGFVAVRTLYAQGHGGMMGMMSMMKDCPMMGAMTHGPEAALRHRAELGLSADQTQRLEALRGSTPNHGAMMARMQEIHAKMNAATEGATFDEAAARAAFEEMNTLHTRMGIEMLRTRHAVRQILTPEQREKLAELGRGGMMGSMHGMMGSMMENCPMMKGGMMSGHHGMQQEG
jgi:Spy/CpxP family protein refolding chaperone